MKGSKKKKKKKTVLLYSVRVSRVQKYKILEHHLTACWIFFFLASSSSFFFSSSSSWRFMAAFFLAFSPAWRCTCIYARLDSAEYFWRRRYRISHQTCSTPYRSSHQSGPFSARSSFSSPPPSAPLLLWPQTLVSASRPSFCNRWWCQVRERKEK